MTAIPVYRFKVPTSVGEALADKWATAEAIVAHGGKRVDDVEWTVLAEWVDERGLTVDGVYERSTHFQLKVLERLRTPEEAAQHWLDGPNQQ